MRYSAARYGLAGCPALGPAAGSGLRYGAAAVLRAVQAARRRGQAAAWVVVDRVAGSMPCFFNMAIQRGALRLTMSAS